MIETADHDHILRILPLLNAAIASSRFYFLEHPEVSNAIAAAHGEITARLRKSSEITLVLIGDELVAGNRPLRGGGEALAQFTRILQETGLERLTFLSGLPIDDFGRWVMDMASSEAGSIRSSPWIRLGKVELDEQAKKQQDERAEKVLHLTEEVEEQIQALKELRDLKLVELREFCERIKQRQPVDLQGMGVFVNHFISGFMRDMNPLLLLASLKSANEYTFTHVINVCILTMSQAEALGFEGQLLHQIGIASMLHDAGKLFIPEDILNKTGSLTPEEREVVQTHTVKGARYILGLQGIPKLAALGALEHHLRYDGSGYPAIGKGWRPNIVSQMIAIADVFDAMRSRRPYQEPRPQRVILELLKKQTGTAFNPFLVENFVKLLSR